LDYIIKKLFLIFELHNLKVVFNFLIVQNFLKLIFG